MEEKVFDPKMALDEYNREMFGEPQNEVARLRAELAEQEETERRDKLTNYENTEVQRMVDGLRSVPGFVGLSDEVSAVICLFTSAIGNEMVSARRGDWLSPQTWQMFLSPRHWVKAMQESTMEATLQGITSRYESWKHWRRSQKR